MKRNAPNRWEKELTAKFLAESSMTPNWLLRFVNTACPPRRHETLPQVKEACATIKKALEKMNELHEKKVTTPF